MRLHGQHAARLHRRLQRQVQHGAARQRVGAGAGRLAVVEDPLGQHGVDGFALGGPAFFRTCLIDIRYRKQPARCRDEEERGVGVERGTQEASANLHDLLRGQRRRQLPRQLVERAGVGLAPHRHARLLAQAGSQLADDQPHRQQHHKGEQVLHVADGEREPGRHEKEIERPHRQHRSQRRRPPPVPQRHAHHGGQEQHGDVDDIEPGPGDCGKQCGPGTPDHGPDIVKPARARLGRILLGHGARRQALRCRQRCRAGGVRRHADHVDFRAASRQRIGKGLAADQPVAGAQHRRQGAPQQHAPLLEPSAFVLPVGARAAHQHLGEVVAAHVAGDRAHHVVPGQCLGAGAQFLGQPHRRAHAGAHLGGQRHQPGRGNRHYVPVAIELAGQPARAAHHLLGVVAGADAGHQRLARAPDRFDRLGVAIGAHIVIDAIRRAPQRQFAQRDQVALAEEVARGMARLLGQVDLALAQAAQQFVGGQVHQHDVVGIVEHGIGHGLPDPHAGDAAHGLVQALQVLHVDRGPDVDAGGQQFGDVLPALGMPAAGGVGVGQFVHQHQRGMAREHAIEIEFLEDAVAVGHFAQRHDVQPGDQRLGLGAAVGLHHAHHHIHPLRAQRAGGGEHRERLSHAGRGAEVDPQLAAPGARALLLHALQQGVGVRAVVGEGHGRGGGGTDSATAPAAVGWRIHSIRRPASPHPAQGSASAHSPRARRTRPAPGLPCSPRSGPPPAPPTARADAPRAPPGSGPPPG
ncbi:hypothetical protein D3C86_1019590 [compost metagenome]